MYVLYISNDRILLTAIIEDETVLVNAMNNSTKKAIIPDSPSRALTRYGITMPLLTSVVVISTG